MFRSHLTVYQIVHILQIKTVNFAIPIPVLSISPSDLSDLWLHSYGQEVLDIVRAQHISSIESLLWTSDILAFIHLPAFGLNDLKRKVAFELNDGSWSVMSVFRTRVDLFMNALRSQALLEENSCSSLPQSSDNIALTHPLSHYHLRTAKHRVTQKCAEIVTKWGNCAQNERRRRDSVQLRRSAKNNDPMGDERLKSQNTMTSLCSVVLDHHRCAWY